MSSFYLFPCQKFRSAAYTKEDLDDFGASMPQHELLNCADSSALLISDFDSCGIATFDTSGGCRAFSVTQKSCATGYYRWEEIK